MNQISSSQQKDVPIFNVLLAHYFSTRHVFYSAQRQNTLFYMGSAAIYKSAIDGKFNTINQSSFDPNQMAMTVKGIRPASIILSTDDLNALNLDQIKTMAQVANKSGADIVLVGIPQHFVKKSICDAGYYEKTDHKKSLQISCFQPLAIRTLNCYGTQIQLDEPQRAFIDIAKNPGIKSLDIGSGFGNTVLHAAYAGAQNIHAWELDSANVKALSRAVQDTEFTHCIHTRQVDFRHYDVEAQDNEAYDIILISRVLHFFSPEDIASAAKKLFKLLKPGGILHVTASTVFLQVASAYIPQYLKKLNTHQPWPGYVDADTFREHIDPEHVNIHPQAMTAFDPIFPAKTFTDSGFEVLKNDYLSRLGCHDSRLHLAINGSYAEHRGKEAIWLILQKPDRV